MLEQIKEEIKALAITEQATDAQKEYNNGLLDAWNIISKYQEKEEANRKRIRESGGTMKKRIEEVMEVASKKITLKTSLYDDCAIVESRDYLKDHCRKNFQPMLQALKETHAKLNESSEYTADEYDAMCDELFQMLVEVIKEAEEIEVPG